MAGTSPAMTRLRAIKFVQDIMATQKDASAAVKSNELGALPEWDLSDLYPGRDSPELTRAL